jgi:hypothetical protein
MAAAFLGAASPAFAKGDASELADGENDLRGRLSAFKTEFTCVENPSLSDVWKDMWRERDVPGRFRCSNKKGESGGYNKATPEQVKVMKQGICVDLSAAPLAGADLVEAILSCAKLTGAHLNGAKLMLAGLSGADLRGADLTGANLKGAVLLGADLTGADLTGAGLEGAEANQYTRLPFGREEALKRGIVFR